MDGEPLLTLSEAAKSAFGGRISATTLWRACRARRLAHVRIGNRYFVELRELERYERACTISVERPRVVEFARDVLLIDQVTRRAAR